MDEFFFIASQRATVPSFPISFSDKTWQHEKENRNQIEIVNTARELLTRMNSFLLTFEEVGKALSSLQDTYDKARGVIVDAPHAQTIAKSAQKLIGLHVRLESRRGNRLEMAECLKTADDETVEQS